MKGLARFRLLLLFFLFSFFFCARRHLIQSDDNSFDLSLCNSIIWMCWYFLWWEIWVFSYAVYLSVLPRSHLISCLKPRVLREKCRQLLTPWTTWSDWCLEVYEDQVLAEPVGESTPKALNWKEVRGEVGGEAASCGWGHRRYLGVKYLNWTQKLAVLFYCQ